MAAMIKELRRMVVDVERNMAGLVMRYSTFAPFIQAMHININAFFDKHNVLSVCKLYEAVIHWLPERSLNCGNFKYQLRLVTEGWIQTIKPHPQAIVFFGKHLINVITKWPVKANAAAATQKKRGRK